MRRIETACLGAALLALGACTNRPAPPGPDAPASAGVPGQAGPADTAEAGGAPTAGQPAKEPYENFTRSLHPDDAAVLAGADSLVLYKLDPERAQTGPDAFHGFRILGRTPVSATSRGAVVALVDGMIRDSDGVVAKCFDPRHGISARKGDATVDLVICFECYQMYVYSKHPSLIPIEPKHGPALDALVNQPAGR
ncbi:MAG: hypothetical protein WKG00_25320 [Polyangiaceae bacterium]